MAFLMKPIQGGPIHFSLEGAGVKNPIATEKPTGKFCRYQDSQTISFFNGV